MKYTLLAGTAIILLAWAAQTTFFNKESEDITARVLPPGMTQATETIIMSDALYSSAAHYTKQVLLQENPNLDLDSPEDVKKAYDRFSALLDSADVNNDSTVTNDELYEAVMTDFYRLKGKEMRESGLDSMKFALSIDAGIFSDDSTRREAWRYYIENPEDY